MSCSSVAKKLRRRDLLQRFVFLLSSSKKKIHVRVIVFTRIIVRSALVYGLLCAFISRVEGIPPDPLVAFLNNQVQRYTTFNTTFSDQGLGRLVATFNANYVTYDMLPELTDSDLIQLGVVNIGWRLLFCRAISRLDSQDTLDLHQDPSQHNQDHQDYHQDKNQDNTNKTTKVEVLSVEVSCL